MAPVINGNDPSVAFPTSFPWEDWVCDIDCSIPPKGVVRVQRHSPDFEDLSTSAALRAEVLRKEKHPCSFVNPLVTILSRDPTPEFLRMVKKHQGDWIRRTRSCFPRKMRRKVSNWVTDQGGFGNRYFRYLDRCFQATSGSRNTRCCPCGSMSPEGTTPCFQPDRLFHKRLPRLS